MYIYIYPYKSIEPTCFYLDPPSTHKKVYFNNFFLLVFSTFVYLYILLPYFVGVLEGSRYIKVTSHTPWPILDTLQKMTNSGSW